MLPRPPFRPVPTRPLTSPRRSGNRPARLVLGYETGVCPGRRGVRGRGRGLRDGLVILDRVKDRTDGEQTDPAGEGGAAAPALEGRGALRRAQDGLWGLFRPRVDVAPFSDEEGDAVASLLSRYQLRALHLQAVLRLGLVVAASAEFFLFPPRMNEGATAAVLVLYAVYALVMLAISWRRNVVQHVAWLVPVVDLPALALLLSMPGNYNEPQWSNPFTSDWLLMVIIMSAFQLRPEVTAVTGAAATVFYGLATTVGQPHDALSLHHALGHTLTLALVSLAALLLSRIQQQHASNISELAHDRAVMLATTLSIMERDRRDLAESLHDGPLQSVLAARLDVDEATNEPHPHSALVRADEALRDAARQLRSSVTELHPSVLDRTGLEQALTDLARRAGERGKFTVQVICSAPTAGAEADRVLYNCAREFLTNVVKHAQARHVVVRFETDGVRAMLLIADDGIGLPPHVLEERVAQGHIGIASQQLRLQEIGGTLRVGRNTPTGTVVRVSFPVSEDSAAVT